MQESLRHSVPAQNGNSHNSLEEATQSLPLLRWMNFVVLKQPQTDLTLQVFRRRAFTSPAKWEPFAGDQPFDLPQTKQLLYRWWTGPYKAAIYWIRPSVHLALCCQFRLIPTFLGLSGFGLPPSPSTWGPTGHVGNLQPSAYQTWTIPPRYGLSPLVPRRSRGEHKAFATSGAATKLVIMIFSTITQIIVIDPMYQLNSRSLPKGTRKKPKQHARVHQ